MFRRDYARVAPRRYGYNSAMSEFQPLSNLLAAVLPPGVDAPAADPVQQKLAQCWQRQAGAAAAHSRTLLFTSGRLVVFAESASWGNEIRHRTHSLMEALAGDGFDLNALQVKIQPDAPPAE